MYYILYKISIGKVNDDPCQPEGGTADGALEEKGVKGVTTWLLSLDIQKRY